MFGLFRVILALLVLYSHVYLPKTHNIGLSAVIGFFMISGYVMTQLINANYNKLGRSTWYFYLDRFMRIYPQFFLFLLLMQLCVLAFKLSFGPFSAPPTFLGFFLNATLVPLNYNNLIPAIRNYVLIPATWSLALEEQYYWVFPFLVLKKGLGYLVTVASFGLFCFSIFALWNPDLLYRRVPSILFVFMLGKYLADFKRTKNRDALWSMTAIYAACLTLFCVLIILDKPAYSIPSTLDVLGGVLIGFPIIAFLSRLPRQKWDEFLGRASYGIFLCHLMVLCVFVYFKLFVHTRLEMLLMVSMTSTVLGFFGYFAVERFMQPLRYRLRQRAKP